jgi:dihydroorotate dehydrogenase (NAD+) catalytic subunit
VYDPSLSYDENYNRGPFAKWCLPTQHFTKISYLDKPTHQFLGMPAHIPFGIPAGPLLNSRFVAAAWDAGLSVATYKTVRSQFWASHAHPNVLSISLPHSEPLDSTRRLTAEQMLRAGTPPPRVVARSLDMTALNTQNGAPGLSISNSFGVPSKSPHEWQNDVKLALASRGKIAQSSAAEDPRILVLSFQGSRAAANTSDSAFAEDAVLCQQLALESFHNQTNQKYTVLEVNLSCPNERGAPIYTNVTASLKLLEALKRNRPDTGVKFIVKIGSLSNDLTLDFVRGAKGLVDAIAAINTVSATILSPQGETILGSGDRTGGVCGELIFQENLSMLERLVEARERTATSKSEMQLVSVGGVTTVERFLQVRTAGADHVQAATACMWNQSLAPEVAKALGVRYQSYQTQESMP